MKKKIEEAERWKSAAWDMLYLTVCAINGCIPEKERIKNMDLEKVYACSRRQSLETVTYPPLERVIKEKNVPLNVDEKRILGKWEESNNKGIRKTLLMNVERQLLFKHLEDKKIWHLPLKGVVLAPMYPGFGMRQMADNDVLFDGTFRKSVREWFEAHGYTVVSYERGNHDEYHKEPIYNFEMHTDLFSQKAHPQFFQYYLSLKDKLLPIPGKSYEFRMSEEDFYIYILTHEYKHYSGSGTGLRSLLDLYVYNKAKENLNGKYLKEELEKLGLCEFENEMRTLAFKIFTPDCNYDSLTVNERKTLCKLLFGRTYGTIENYWRKQVTKIQTDGSDVSTAVKVKYLLRRVFPGAEHMEQWCQLYAPFFLEHRWLMPAAGIWRMIQAQRRHGKMLKREFDTVRKMRD